MESAKSALTLVQRKQGALLGLFVGDALAMPVHWYYKLDDIKADYGAINGFI